MQTNMEMGAAIANDLSAELAALLLDRATWRQRALFAEREVAFERARQQAQTEEQKAAPVDIEA